ncbi:MAG: gluconate 2-dehydrogenase subunit 3 family protein [Moraxellaceae bacterium]|nr:MAG: gluconate 2-dehydrogenase subunit 3 family protein [Moraxellaceae bacterium]
MPHNNKLADAIGVETEAPRRTALKQMGLLFGLSLSAQSLDVLAATVKGTMPLATKFFTPDQLQMTGQIADLIIPTTDTPGALAVNVHGFLDGYLAECVSKEEQKQFLEGLKRINIVTNTKFHKPFLACSHKQHIQLLTAIEKPEMGFTAEDKNFFKQFKSLTLFGYYTSEVGATQELAYLAIPGGYKGNFPFAKIGKAWALN